MSFWSFFKGKAEPEESPMAEERAEATVRPKAVEHGVATFGAEGDASVPERFALLERTGMPDGPTTDEALASLDGARHTRDEAFVVEALARAAYERPLTDALLAKIAMVLIERGDRASAGRILDGAGGLAALLLRADLAEDRGDTALARRLLERIVAETWNYPGARERLARLRGETKAEIASAAQGLPGPIAFPRSETPFELVREVGRGGAATVYEAIDRTLGRRVALKIFHASHHDHAQLLLHEGRIAAAFAGPSVARVFDVDPQDGWIALEWIPGGSLRTHLRSRNVDGLLPIARWAVPLASLLARMHDAGFVHLDIKPTNVLLDDEGAAVVADFGTARGIGEPCPQGSRGYVSPARTDGRPSDPRDDIYGFGRTLEDVLEGIADAEIRSRYQPLVAACLSAGSSCPANGRELLALLAAG